MKRSTGFVTSLAVTLFAAPLTLAAAGMTPGQYEYTVKINMPGAPSMPAQTLQRCLTAKDVAGDKGFEVPPSPGSDCQIKDLTQTGGQFAYKVACTKPEKMDGTVKGTHTPTGMTMDMTMTMAGAPGPIMQSISARRVGDCKR